MSVVHEEVRHSYIDAEIEVVQRVKGECVEDWHITYLRIDSMSRMTPKDLREFGRWLVEQGARIERKYTKAGKPKQPKGANIDAALRSARKEQM